MTSLIPDRPDKVGILIGAALCGSGAGKGQNSRIQLDVDRIIGWRDRKSS